MDFKRQLPPDEVVVSDGTGASPHNYMRKLNKLVADGVLRRGEMSVLNIAHDDWCELYSKGPCNCDPEVVNRITGQKY